MKVLITGASSGMGKEMAKIISEKADELVLVARNEEELNNVKDEIFKNRDIKIKTISADLSNQKKCIEIHDNVKDVDLLINNAGFGDYGYFNETSIDKDLSMIGTNVMAVHILTKLYLADMMKKNSGHILNVASIAGFMPGPLMSTYYATKNYVVKLSEGIREELRRSKSKVGISILCPGPVKTNFENNANIGFKFNGISSEYVAKYALSHLDKFYIVPGFYIRVSRRLMKILPTRLVSKIIFKMQSNKKI